MGISGGGLTKPDQAARTCAKLARKADNPLSAPGAGEPTMAGRTFTAVRRSEKACFSPGVRLRAGTYCIGVAGKVRASMGLDSRMIRLAWRLSRRSFWTSEEMLAA